MGNPQPTSHSLYYLQSKDKKRGRSAVHRLDVGWREDSRLRYSQASLERVQDNIVFNRVHLNFLTL